MRLLQRLPESVKRIARRFLPPEMISKRYFKGLLGYPLNLRNPQSFNEKLQWLKLYDYPQNPLAIQCTDKFGVRQYVSDMGLGGCLNTLIGVWDSVDEIDWNALPEQFAMKCTHGCDYNILCKSKAALDIEKAKKDLRAWLKIKYGYYYAELHYNRIQPRIICETYLGENIVNYKFFCFHGEPKFMYLVQGKGAEKRLTCLDLNQKPLPYKQHFLPVLESEGMMDGFDEMANISARLSLPFRLVRVDLYRVDGQIYLGELTLTPSAGAESFCPKEYDQKLGELLSLS